MMRTALSLILSFVLVVTSQSAAVARGSNPGVDHIVICAGLITKVIYVDAQGQPTEASHLCPDCALHVLGAVFPPLVDPARMEASADAIVPRQDVALRTQHLDRYQSRGPPPGLI